MTREYKKQFPQDDHNLNELLKTVTKQRNFFMHVIWIWLAMGGSKRDCLRLLSQYVKKSNVLMDKIYSLPVN